MTDRWIIAAWAALALLAVGSLAVSGPLLKMMLTGPVEYTERSRCEASPAGPVLEELRRYERAPYAYCDLEACLEITTTLAPTARRLHDPSSVEDC